jgi:hypothetical protein
MGLKGRLRKSRREKRKRVEYCYLDCTRIGDQYKEAILIQRVHCMGLIGRNGVREKR